jgi:HK97 family phage major capsid protein
MAKLHELQERRCSVVSEMRSLNDIAEKETRDYTADEDKRHRDLKTELTGLDHKIERARDLAEAERSAPAILHSGRLGDGAYEQRAREFSITKAIGAALGEDVDAGFEREISAEVKRRSGGRKFQGIAIPDQVFIERRAFGDNVMTIGEGTGSGAASELYQVQHRPDLFIDRLRSALVVGRLGATVLDGLVGEQQIPRQTGSATAQWLAEDEDIDDTALAFDDVTLLPRTVGAITSYSRRTLINATPSIEQIVRNDLAAVIASAIDTAALTGDGSGNKPKGVTAQTNVTEMDLSGGATWEGVLDFVATIDGADAALGSLGWAMSAWSAKKLRATTRVQSDGSAGYIMEGPNSLAGYPVAISSAFPGDGSTAGTGTVIFGAWSQLLVGYWSGTDLLVNPYADSAYARGRVLVRAMRDCDVGVRHSEAFCFAANLPTV